VYHVEPAHYDNPPPEITKVFEPTHIITAIPFTPSVLLPVVVEFTRYIVTLLPCKIVIVEVWLLLYTVMDCPAVNVPDGTVTFEPVLTTEPSSVESNV
jgi:hypothetical protein